MAKKQFEIIIDEDRCRSCAICWEVCAPNVLDHGAPMHKAFVVDGDACTGCRLCEWMCPDWAIVVRPKVENDQGVAA